ncbi:hypothetical protein CRM22_003892 [Opisthorchis felineus]|uniref:Uncharacterized protein n=1 Tax=Opisthorchis felineus TaxID=147828 RepID=A0A4S2LZ02_OPIFE|nr:hypothetical protein CRM22_003892 [Opisthorchis felineus]
MSDNEGASDSSDFSDGYPTTTTISTVAVQAGDARIVLAVLREQMTTLTTLSNVPEGNDISKGLEKNLAMLQLKSPPDSAIVQNEHLPKLF